MVGSIDRIKELTQRLDERIALKNSGADIDKTLEDLSCNDNLDNIRKENISIVNELYIKLNIYTKSPDFGEIFLYKAMNLSGVGLKEEDFGEVREGKYIQIIAITYEPDKNGKKKAKNISLGYFGKAQTLDPELKNDIIEFVLRWRYEKAFQTLEHYKELIARLDAPITIEL
ncbi:hypothetical protein MNB_SV-15-391 [hydrothermal vent metagenome]|uniref:Uncharacterized protein n=1 Tax=hydrothermal vent metagenome TaxID=652676 RepID=A0A1W1EHE4_9ZZZZ